MEQMKLKDRLSAKVQTLQTTPAQPSSDYLALNGSTLDLIHENLKDQPLTYNLSDVRYRQVALGRLHRLYGAGAGR